MTSDEPDDAITGSTTVNLRAERQGAGDGRVYQVYFTVTDPSGHSTQATCPVFIPHDDPHEDSGTPANDSGVRSGVGPRC